MVLAYPELPADVLAGRPPDRHRLCRTFSDCTTGPRNGMVSGCYPLDPFYRERPERRRIALLRPGGRRAEDA
jgi:NADPH2 dehydrogenase